MTRDEFRKAITTEPAHMLYAVCTMRLSWGEGLQRHVPLHMQQSIVRYICMGGETGHFLRALLSNDLMRAFDRADETNSDAMRDWVQFLYNYAPTGCWGSVENYEAWQGLLPAEENC